MSNIINLTPNPRILRMLGEINFQPWQCIAELIDNSIDAYLKTLDAGEVEEMKLEVRVKIPNATEFAQKEPIVVWDNASGMSEEELENSLKAGFSGNDPVSNLGLFGMGFNIATARLGGKTKVRTARKEDQKGLEIEIDFAEMINSGSFNRTINEWAKDNDNVHGTTVAIYGLHERYSSLGQQGLFHLRKKLTSVYSLLIREYPVDIFINGERLETIEKCVWRPERYVTRGDEKIFARQEIDEDLGSLYYCSTCWAWLDVPLIDGESCACKICNSPDNVIVRDRKVKGWLGVQRYYDKDNYGIDIYRNGRLIEPLDKSMFFWTNPVTGEEELEYPLDATHWGGRIVGEIEANFLTVNYTKDSFVKGDILWQKFQEYLRGKGPLRPNVAKYHGYDKNDSPLGRLYAGYRKGNRPGYEDLLPGKYNKTLSRWEGNNSEPKSWSELFYKGEEDYIEDTKWWDLVEDVEFNRRGSDASETDGFDPTNPLDSIATNTGSTVHETPDESIPDEYSTVSPETSSTSSVAVATTLEEDEAISGPYVVEELDEQEIVVKSYKDYDLPDDKPFVLEKQSQSNFKFTYKPSSLVFLHTKLTPKEVLLIELSSSLYARKNDPEEWPISKILIALKQQYSRELSLDPRIVKLRASELVGKIKNKLASLELPVDKNIKDNNNLFQIVSRAVFSRTGEGAQKAKQVLTTTEFIAYLPDIEVLKFYESQPFIFFDGNVFRVPYEELENPELQEEILTEYKSYINDVMWVISTIDEDMSNDMLKVERCATSISILEEQLS